jgi:NADH-quinone oxidoreductase subunit I
MNFTGYPTIEIDAAKCTVPFACKKCLEVCPQAVFFVFGIKHERGREIDPNEPGAYGLGVAYQDKCTGCDDCIEVCPSDAITITFPEMEA